MNTSLLAFTWSPDSQFIAGCPIEDNQLKLAIWRVDTGQISSSEYFTEMTFEPSAFTTAIAWSPDGRHIVSNGAVLALWDMEHNTDPRILRTYGEGGTAVAWNSTGDRFASVGLDIQPLDGLITGSLQVWDVESEKVVIDLGKGYKVAACSPDDRLLASINAESNIEIWDLSTEKLTKTLTNSATSVITDLDWSPNGLWLASSDTDHLIRLWSTQIETAVIELNGHTDLIASLDWHPVGDKIVSAGIDGTIRIWSKVN